MTTQAMPAPHSVFIQRLPDGPFEQASGDGQVWHIHDITVSHQTEPSGSLLKVDSPHGPLSRVALRWNSGVPEQSRILGDAWERSYGELSWQGTTPHRALPWYWLAHDDTTGATLGAGVKVAPAAWCSWTVDVDGITLWADLRSGQHPVKLGGRQLTVAELISIESDASPFEAQLELVQSLATGPKSTAPIVGANNWYYAYGDGFDAEAVVQDARIISRLAGDHPVRPFSVIDAGWAEGHSTDGGPWDNGKDSFSDMAAVAERIRAEGARPGLWFRPLLSRVQTANTLPYELDGGWPLDPTRQETLDLVAEDIRRFKDWGYELIKHDFSTFDVLGDFAPQFGPSLGNAPWHFADESRTTAEVLRTFYEVVADAAGDTIVIGCNTVGHLAAGLEDLQRIGDDTSGKQWERTRRMGINSLAFRLAQHGQFFTADADCVAVTAATPWDLNRQFLDLVANSGTALFLSVDPQELNSNIEEELARAVRTALDGGIPGGVEPLDFLHSAVPRRWRIGGQTKTYDWSGPLGAEGFIHNI